MVELNRVYCCDCMEGMKQLEDKTVNLEILDLPYNIGKDSWDKIADYENWVMQVIKECERILKDNGSFYFFHSEMPVIADLMQRIKKETKFVFKQFIPWNKRFDGASNKGFLDGFVIEGGLRNYQQMAEYILFYTFSDGTGLERILSKENFLQISEKIREYVEKNFTKEYIEKLFLNEGRYTSQLSAKVHASYKMGWNNGKRFDLMDKKLYTYLNNYLKFPFKYESLKSEYESLLQEYESLRYTFNNQKTHHSVWNYEIAEKNGHLTPKPEPLIENIILHSSNEGDLVFDPTIGTGTTICMAKRHNRNFIGFDNNPEYCKRAEKRLEQETFTSFLEKENREDRQL